MSQRIQRMSGLGLNLIDVSLVGTKSDLGIWFLGRGDTGMIF